MPIGLVVVGVGEGAGRSLMGCIADGMENKFQPRYQFPRSFLVVVARLSMEGDDMGTADGIATRFTCDNSHLD